MKVGKIILYNENARRELLKGINIMVEAVASTLGPKGRNVVLERPNSLPQIINDGVTIAREIELGNNLKDTGVSLIRQAASKTNDVAGDGTTTATVLAFEILEEGIRQLNSGINPIAMKVGMQKALRYLVAQITEYSEPIEDLNSISQVATISSGNDIIIGNMIADALKQVGKDGLISLEDSKTMSTELQVSEGMRFNKGFISPYFMTNPEKMEAVLENAYVLITDKKLTLIKQDLLPVLEQVMRVLNDLCLLLLLMLKKKFYQH